MVYCRSICFVVTHPNVDSRDQQTCPSLGVFINSPRFEPYISTHWVA